MTLITKGYVPQCNAIRWAGIEKKENFFYTTLNQKSVFNHNNNTTSQPQREAVTSECGLFYALKNKFKTNWRDYTIKLKYLALVL